MKRRILRCLQKLLCDKHELNRFVLKYRKRFREACAALEDKR